MESRFKNSRSRLDRAYVHYKEFLSEWHALLDDKSPTPLTRKDKESGWYTVSANLDPSAVERIKRNNLSLILGEIAYQLRASLDGLIWDAITFTQGTEPPYNANRLEFPILNGQNRDFKSCAFHKYPFPAKLADWMETIQPGTVEKPVGDLDRGLQQTLEDIHNLARFDRHRRLRMVGVVPYDAGIKVDSTPRGGEIVEIEWLHCDLFNGNYDFVRIKVVCPGGLTPYHLGITTNVTFEVAAEDVPLYNRENIGFQLGRFIHAVEHVINRFDVEFP